MSWKSHWSGSHELADKIFAQYDRPFSDNDKASDNSPPLRKPRPNYVESGSDSESNIGSSSVSELETGSDLDDLDELLKADSDDVGPAGGSYTDTDMRNFVLYLAGLPEESSVSWSDYYEMVRCQLLEVLIVLNVKFLSCSILKEQKSLGESIIAGTRKVEHSFLSPLAGTKTYILY